MCLLISQLSKKMPRPTFSFFTSHKERSGNNDGFNVQIISFVPLLPHPSLLRHNWQNCKKFQVHIVWWLDVRMDCESKLFWGASFYFEIIKYNREGLWLNQNGASGSRSLQAVSVTSFWLWGNIPYTMGFHRLEVFLFFIVIPLQYHNFWVPESEIINGNSETENSGYLGKTNIQERCSSCRGSHTRGCCWWGEGAHGAQRPEDCAEAPVHQRRPLPPVRREHAAPRGLGTALPGRYWISHIANLISRKTSREWGWRNRKVESPLGGNYYFNLAIKQTFPQVTQVLKNQLKRTYWRGEAGQQSQAGALEEIKPTRLLCSGIGCLSSPGN